MVCVCALQPASHAECAVSKPLCVQCFQYRDTNQQYQGYVAYRFRTQFACGECKIQTPGCPWCGGITLLARDLGFKPCISISRQFTISYNKPIKRMIPRNTATITQIGWVVITWHNYMSCWLIRNNRTVWPSGLRRWLKGPVRKGVGSNPTAVKCTQTHPLSNAIFMMRLHSMDHVYTGISMAGKP